MKLTNSESSLIDAMLDVLRKALRSYLPTQRKSSTRSTSVQTALTDRGSTIRAASRSGKSKSSAAATGGNKEFCCLSLVYYL